MRQSFGLWIVLSALCLAGCGYGDRIWVTGTLQKGGEIYKPPESRKLALYFCPIEDAVSGKPAGDIEMADYDPRDGSFTVPGAEGYGISPGKYRIAVVETLRRDALKESDSSSKPTGGRNQKKRFDFDKNFLEDSFGMNTSPFVRELKTSTKLALDMAKPAE
jgi:hypothetical protein